MRGVVGYKDPSACCSWRRASMLFLLVWCSVRTTSSARATLRNMRVKGETRGGPPKQLQDRLSSRLLKKEGKKRSEKQGSSKGSGSGSSDGDEETRIVPSLQLVGISENEFNEVGKPICFKMEGSELGAAAFAAINYELDPLMKSIYPLVYLEDIPTRLDYSLISEMDATHVCTKLLLQDGRNNLVIEAPDNAGQVAHFQATVWAGAGTIQVSLVDAVEQNPYLSKAEVTAYLVDNSSLRISKEASDGLVTFKNIPEKMVLFEALGENEEFGTAFTLGQDIEIALRGFKEPNAITNLDFAQGLEGWQEADGSEGSLSLIDHSEQIGPLAATDEVGGSLIRQLADNQDLVLSTRGEGEQHVSHTFFVGPGVHSFSARFRFETSEYPTYFGSIFNDYYSISVRPEGGIPASETTSMNVLGHSAFDVFGKTSWREISVTVDPGRVVKIQVEITVANVGDGAVDSRVIIDKCESHSCGTTGARKLEDENVFPQTRSLKPAVPYSTISTRQCFRDYAGIKNTLSHLKNTFPELVSVKSIGTTYRKDNPSTTVGMNKIPLVEEGDDINVLVLTSKKRPTPEKGKMLLFSGIHARELAPVELALRFAEEMVECYLKRNAECLSILDYNEIHIVPVANPDGRLFVEWQIAAKEPKYYWDVFGERTYGEELNITKPEHPLWERRDVHLIDNLLLRKNRNTAICADATAEEVGQSCGIDLNRNFDFAWEVEPTWETNDSDLPLSTVYRGAGVESEPETKALADYARTLFHDTVKKDDPYEGKDLSKEELKEPYPTWSSGLFLDLHSFSRLILWPWSYREVPAPNSLALEAFARKMSSFNGYKLAGAGHEAYLYASRGATQDFFYGKLGVAAYVLEIGGSFYEKCSLFEKENAENIPMLKYSALNAKYPFSTPLGPDITEMTLSKASLNPEDTLAVTVKASDKALIDPTYSSARQSVDAIWLYIDSHPYGKDSEPFTRSFSSEATFEIEMKDIQGLDSGDHTLFAVASDNSGHWGVVKAQTFALDFCAVQ